MNNVLIFIGVGLVVIAGAWFLLGAQDSVAPTEPAPTPDQLPDTPNTTPVDDAEEDAAEAFPSAVTENVIAAIVETTTYTENEVRIDSVTEQTWPNGCLGLAQPDEMCTEALVSGYEVRAEAGEEVFIYRTNSTGSQLRREE